MVRCKICKDTLKAINETNHDCIKELREKVAKLERV